MASKLTPQEYDQVVQQVSSWLYEKTKNPKAVEEAKLFVSRIESQTTSKEDFLKTINEKIQRLQKKPVTTMDNIKWILEKKDILQNILSKFEATIAADKAYEKSLPIVAREGFVSLKKILSLDLRPNVSIDGSLYIEDIHRIKKSLTIFRDLFKDRSQENNFLEEEPLCFVILMEYFILVEQMRTDKSIITGILSTGKLQAMQSKLTDHVTKFEKFLNVFPTSSVTTTTTTTAPKYRGSAARIQTVLATLKKLISLLEATTSSDFSALSQPRGSSGNEKPLSDEDQQAIEVLNYLPFLYSMLSELLRAEKSLLYQSRNNTSQRSVQSIKPTTASSMTSSTSSSNTPTLYTNATKDLLVKQLHTVLSRHALPDQQQQSILTERVISFIQSTEHFHDPERIDCWDETKKRKGEETEELEGGSGAGKKKVKTMQESIKIGREGWEKIHCYGTIGSIQWPIKLP